MGSNAHDLITNSFKEDSESSVFGSPVSSDFSMPTCLGMEDIEGLFASSLGSKQLRLQCTESSDPKVGEVFLSIQT